MHQVLLILTARRRPIAIFSLTLLLSTAIFIASVFLQAPKNPSSSSQKQQSMAAARSFVLWLHGLGDSGPANEPIKTLFTSPEFRTTKWSFPSAPIAPVSCNYGAKMPSWFDIHEIPVTADSPKDESSLLKAVQHVHAMIDKEIAAGTNPENVFVCGFSQGGALTLSSILLYPKTLGGGAVFSGWVPFNSSIMEQVSPDAKRTPILWLHGMADATVLFEAGQAGPPFLEQAGISCEFKAYPGLGHSISNAELKYLESWIKTRLPSSS
ncbi:hypothetical protein H0E87_020253 [Populus deltoides]|uniref:Phospholipase/carboxylesterase/thioesterase domain-containing protein n=1 Tax=Populus deltoides TaxID=3696 RepID=A0A8T2XIT3_POPDE|nr:hypothetical protein H0E87_020253 [Populus deltoides]